MLVEMQICDFNGQNGLQNKLFKTSSNIRQQYKPSDIRRQNHFNRVSFSFSTGFRTRFISTNGYSTSRSISVHCRGGINDFVRAIIAVREDNRKTYNNMSMLSLRGANISSDL